MCKIDCRNPAGAIGPPLSRSVPSLKFGFGAIRHRSILYWDGLVVSLTCALGLRPRDSRRPSKISLTAPKRPLKKRCGKPENQNPHPSIDNLLRQLVWDVALIPRS